MPYGKPPLSLRAMLVKHASQLIGNLLRDVPDERVQEQLETLLKRISWP